VQKLPPLLRPLSTRNRRTMKKKPNRYEKALKDVLFWCKQDAKNEDGYPTQEMFDARVDYIRNVLSKKKKP
jgi:hypothetical protein